MTISYYGDLKYIDIENGILIFNIFKVNKISGYIGSEKLIGELNINLDSSPDYSFEKIKIILNQLSTKYIEFDSIEKLSNKISKLLLLNKNNLKYKVQFV